jgi:cation:H+ antiporter
VINLTLAVGLAVFLIGGLKINRETVKKDALYTVLVSILPLILILDGYLSRWDGIILLSLFFFYLVWLFSKKERFSDIYNHDKEVKAKTFLKALMVFLGSIVMLLLSAEIVINSAVSLAELLNIPPVCIGIILIGAGTALPETYFVVRAALKGKKEMILGSLMGAVIITSLFVLGFVALINPIRIADFSPYLIARIFLIIAAVLFFVFVKTGSRISKKEALILIFLYIIFLVSELVFRS